MADGLLDAVRVLDLSSGVADAVTRLFADLGADVLKVEPPGGCLGRDALPTLRGASIPFAVHNANKRSTVLDPFDDEDCARFLALAAEADILVDTGADERGAMFGTSGEELAARYPHLVVLSITDFGATGSRSSWRATDPVLYAMCGALSRSGPTTGTPVLPPDGIASATAAVQAAWAALAAYYNRLRCGTGDYIDFSWFDAVVMALDPAFGAHGQAAAGVRRSGRWRGRPKNQDAYPIYPCRDGYVRLCVMAPRQWRGLRRWLGEPEQFQDPKFDAIGERFAAWPQISELIRELFAGQTMQDLVAAGQANGVPIAAVLTPARILGSEHFQAVGAITEAELVPGVRTAVPTGYFVVDGRRAGFRTPVPAAGSDEPYWSGNPSVVPSSSGRLGDYPFAGLRILDLGIIVAGGELSRLFGDLGADVIKVESVDYPDGLRQARIGDAMSESFAWTHRNNRGLGLDLRSAEGKKIFGRLVAEADAVFANFKPGTLGALGFSYDELRALNPRIVLAESSAFGDTGPWSARLGYGPLVRATTGVTRLWTSDEATDEAAAGRHGFYDATTVFPDHVVGRVTAIGALAALIHRDRTGRGAHVHISQAEVVVNQLDTLYVTEAALAAGVTQIREDTGLHAVYPCAGDDEWCVISIRSDDEWRRAAWVFDHAGWAEDPRFATGEARLAHRRELVELVSGWTRTRTPLRAAELLQSAGVPAGPMNRPPDVLEDPQLVARNVYSPMTHPLIDNPLPAETGPAPYRHIAAARHVPAPLPGQHTVEICREVLGMNPADIQRLLDDGVLSAPADTV
ncbi:acyl-CoA transferase [Mycobacterium sp. 1165196.3]|uniref:CaiB/BaiF CoA-transferase family protein n=1 Tax=unclassified Mycobacterium TaxID=2642494 RepID=UPI0008004CA6|nr:MULTISPECIES: CoA transferase [unclassified Mycobacterium]OBK30194.1 acyl-CoA transferase [Mycobacterium sp. 1165196.3]OBK94514.1 acyl-CoA transferase [Mycobacterium sp. 1245499.0]